MKVLFSILFFSHAAFALWEEGRPTPTNGLSNPYDLSAEAFYEYDTNGRLHALNYPVSITGLLLPYEPVKKVADRDSRNPLRKLLYKFFQGISKINSFDDMQAWLGLHPYPLEEGEGAYYIPLDDKLTADRMGLSRIHRNNADGFTFSCAACHSADLFGTKVLGLTNRFPKANEFFVKGKKALRLVNSFNFTLAAGANKYDRRMLRKTKKNLKYVEARVPAALGLDTSLAHVAISLSRRAPNEYADKEKKYYRNPREEILRDYIADSKPGVWWNVKYKNRWLLDGSVVSGNPILTNLLWNEIGRGTDLYELEEWIENNKQTIEELTTTVFSVEAPHMTDFFEEKYFNLEKAKLGQKLFRGATCTNCHGNYVKNWDLDNFKSNHWSDIFKTQTVDYPEQTPVHDVGTSENRWRGMASLEQLNHLAISKRYDVKIDLQEGYVPPPLVGIWARWPYFHNNSVPSLCQLMTPPEQRVKQYYSGPANDKETDFDFACNGYPLGKNTPSAWKTKEHLFDTAKPGLSNRGHYSMFLDRFGKERFTQKEKEALLHFLQTL